ncbi:MAG: hypothetical protein HYR72_24310 [Deltaproteobacteria bacterium]|nr:hypothetical protein [Deltaproteobacteria bacterium]MBI3389226.1 hypothetical protein [Deltaproteobacteria bacterium]
MANITWSRSVRYGLGALGLAGLLSVGQAAWAQATPVTDDNIVERITTMKTPAEHQAIAAYYQTKAAAASAEVARHEAMVKAYGGTGMKTMNRHCDLLYQTALQEKTEYESLAKDHADMAASAAK